MSRYLVLGREPSGSPVDPLWRELGSAEANSAEQAVRQLASVKGGSYSVFLAVPERSYQPVRVERVETVQVKVSPATTKPASEPAES